MKFHTPTIRPRHWAGLLAAAVLGAAIATAAPTGATAATATYKLSYASLPNGAKPVMRWNGCQAAITYKVNLAAVPSSLRANFLSETRTSVARLSTLTKIPFSYKGTTTEVPRPGSMPKQTAELIIAWTTPSATSYSLAGSILGQGGFYFTWSSRTLNGKTTYHHAAQRGFVVLDTPQVRAQVPGGFGTGVRRSNLVMHEIGHALGLQHVDDGRQQMYPSLRSTSPSGFGLGDVAGLAKLGRQAGCLPTSYLPLQDLS
jgi:Matrixin